MTEDKPQSLNVCFWFVPPSMRKIPDSLEKRLALGKLTSQIRKVQQSEGKVLVNYADLPDLKSHFFRTITCNPGASSDDMDFLLEDI